MTPPDLGETLLRPQRHARKTTRETHKGLSTEILRQSARRLRILALLYAFTFFMATFVTNLFFESDRAQMMATFVFFIPDVGREVTRAKEFGSYQLVERLGQGGMGEVWRVSHRLLARPAAIKVPRPSLDAVTAETASDALRRFEREAQVTAQLRSPHTVELWDFGWQTMAGSTTSWSCSTVPIWRYS